MLDASSATDGNASAVTPPVRNLSRRPAIEISSSAASQAWSATRVRRGGSTYTSTSSPISLRRLSTIATTREALRARSSESAAVAQRDLERAEPEPVGARPADRRLERTGTAGDHDVQVQRSVGVGQRGQVGEARVADHEPADQGGVRRLAVLAVLLHGLVQGHVAGREDGGVVDQRIEERGTLRGMVATL